MAVSDDSNSLLTRELECDLAEESANGKSQNNTQYFLEYLVNKGFTITETAKMLKVPESTVYGWTYGKKPKSYHFNNLVILYCRALLGKLVKR